MRTRTLLFAALLCLHHAVAHAQPTPDGCTDCDAAPQASPTPALDLRPPQPAPEPGGLHLSLSSARAVRVTGIVLTMTGVAATIAGTVGLSRLGYMANAEGLGIGGVVGGAGAIGVGAGMWAFGDLEVARAEGRSPELTPQMRLHRGRGLRTAGIVLTVLGGVLSLASLVAAVVPEGGSNCDDLCGLGNIIIGGALGGVASTFFGAGIPLLATGASEIRAGNSGITLDGFGPRVMPNGGGVGLSGRF